MAGSGSSLPWWVKRLWWTGGVLLRGTCGCPHDHGVTDDFCRWCFWCRHPNGEHLFKANGVCRYCNASDRLCAVIGHAPEGGCCPSRSSG